MKFTLSWLKEHLETNATLEQICEKLTAIGLEVESENNFAETLKTFTVAEILETAKHPQADKLQICKVNTGTEVLDIVCGAANARVGIKIPLAKIGAIIPNGGFEIKKSKIRGVESNGMLCSASELGITEESEGILELPLQAEVGKPFAPYLGLDDAVIEIAITPNRGDCLGVYGIARDLAAAGLGELKTLNIAPFNSNSENPISVNIESTNCTHFIGVHIKNVQNKPSPEWLKKKLESIGKKPISALVDITNYLTFAFGRPSHIFDADKLNGKITVRNAKEGEKFIALDNKEYALNDNILVVADDKNPVAIAGVIGGLESGCGLDTKNAYLEIAYFNPDAVANSGRKLQIDSDARYRFERSIDFNSYKLVDLAIKLITEICGGEPSKPVMAGDFNYKTKEIDFDFAVIEKVTGLKTDIDLAKSIFTKLGFEIAGNNLKVPSWRNDVSIAEDMAEEYARIVGLDNLPVTYMQKPNNIQPAISPAQKKISNSRRVLSGRGLNEVISFSFMSEEKAKLFAGVDKFIKVANPISSDLGIMRPSIISNLLDAVATNQARGKKSFSLFEIGNIFSKEKDFIQTQSISAIRSGVKLEKSALNKEELFDVFDIKSDCLSVLLQFFDVSKLSAEKNDKFNYYHPGRSGIYRLGPNVIAVFGEIHPSHKQKFDLKQTAFAFEIFTDKLPQAKPKTDFARKPFEISNFQPIERDFAFIVESKVLAQDIISAVRKSEKSISEAVIEDIRIFDIYEGEKLGDGKKSIAFNVRIQPKNATLTDEQINNATSKIVENVRVATGGTLRDA
jgi:phenylalanyl-tRNA synthetase beta chain